MTAAQPDRKVPKTSTTPSMERGWVDEETKALHILRYLPPWYIRRIPIQEALRPASELGGWWTCNYPDSSS